MTETNIETLILDLITPLLKHPAALTISQEDSGRYRQYIVNVAQDDVGRLIGRQGHVAAALRTIVEGARSRRSNSKKVRLLIKDHRH